jgi:alkanesulfonate monooxygenase SsuD/methylene tetrahydromethanopterin reductase-like flavin-dependent oxidoreductase (luciferase family)
LAQPVRIGIVLRFKNPEPFRVEWAQLYSDHLKYAAAVDRLGFDGIFVAEHHCIDSGYNPTPLVCLAAIAGVTRTCRIGTQPFLLPLHNPVLAAEEAAVVDVLSHGRLVFGLGAGYRDGDFEAVGISRKERGGRSEEAIAIITRAMRGEAFDYHGKFYDMKGVKLSPPPVQKDPEFQLAVRAQVVASRAVRHRVNVNLQSREEALLHGPMVVEEARIAGVDSTRIGASIQRLGFIGKSREQAVEASKPYLRVQMEEYIENAGDDPILRADAYAMLERVNNGVGAFTAAEWREILGEDMNTIRSIGLRPDWINLTLWHSGMPVDEAIEALEIFAADVLPHLPRVRTS